MTSHDLRPDDHETLSALFDGELHGEARLFALRRLGHDARWQGSCGRWQAIGDAMRRQAPLAAPADFAARVSASVAALPTAVPGPAPAAAAAPRGRRLRWIGGGALAASLALAVVAIYLPGDPMQPAPAATVVASAPAAAPTSTPTAGAPGLAAQPAAVASTPVAVRDAAAPRVVAAVAPRRERAAVVAAAGRDTPAAVVEAALLAGQSDNPFNLPDDQALTARPWPRATLGGAGAFTARYGQAGDSAAEGPSFYPFEPRPQGEPEPAP